MNNTNVDALLILVVPRNERYCTIFVIREERGKVRGSFTTMMHFLPQSIHCHLNAPLNFNWHCSSVENYHLLLENKKNQLRLILSIR